MRNDSTTSEVIIETTNEVNAYYADLIDPNEPITPEVVRGVINLYLKTVKELIEDEEPEFVKIPRLGKITKKPKALEAIKAVAQAKFV